MTSRTRFQRHIRSPCHHCPPPTQRLSLYQPSAGGCEVILTCTSTRTMIISTRSSWTRLSPSTMMQTLRSIQLMFSVPLFIRSVSFRMLRPSSHVHTFIIVHYTFRLASLHSPVRISPLTSCSPVVVYYCSYAVSSLTHVPNLLCPYSFSEYRVLITAIIRNTMGSNSTYFMDWHRSRMAS